ncbi:MAG: hypothetical protein H6551_07640 [Chitinophagales bacterium]|nr:hypothetical protein [Chitinophagaceae bacterium]MCB9065002.1 hypothetical protein [Chitinophagales bacterium]
MKNLLVTLLLLAFATTLHSCKKTYTCSCLSVWDDQWYDSPIEATSKRKANKVCEGYVAPQLDGPRECFIKD